MNLRTELNDDLYRRYLETLGADPSAPTSYFVALRRFQRFIATQAAPEPLSHATLNAWLKHMATELALRTIVDYIRRVDGFLSWLVKHGRLPVNPWTELRTQYGGDLAPTIRALLAPNPAKALDALRPLPPFGSHLGPRIEHYLRYKQALGFRYEREKQRLLGFDRYLQRRPGAEQQPLHVLVQEYAELAHTPESRFERLQSGRNLVRGLKRYDSSIVVPRLDRIMVQAVMRQRRRPYIFTADEIRTLFATALDFPSPRAPLRPLSLYTALALAYGAGLRIGELVRLTVGDIDLAAGALYIRETKFFKSRCLPLTESVIIALRRYLAARKEAGASEYPTAGLFWNDKTKRGYSWVALEHLLTEVIRRGGLKPPLGREGPRLHDVRHTFVCHRMLAWYKAGVDVESRLPYLATYLGHKDVNSTLVYLTVTQELLQQANDRFHAFGSQVLQTP
jgi:integrase/recombinase XerD